MSLQHMHNLPKAYYSQVHSKIGRLFRQIITLAPSSYPSLVQQQFPKVVVKYDARHILLKQPPRLEQGHVGGGGGGGRPAEKCVRIP